MRSFIRMAPSRREYRVCRWRWGKDMVVGARRETNRANNRGPAGRLPVMPEGQAPSQQIGLGHVSCHAWVGRKRADVQGCAILREALLLACRSLNTHVPRSP